MEHGILTTSAKSLTNEKMKRDSYRKIIVVTCCCVVAELVALLVCFFGIRAVAISKLKTTKIDLVKLIQTSVGKELDLFEYNIRRNAAFTRINGVYLSSKNFTDLLQFSANPSNTSIEAFDFILKLKEADLPAFEDFCDKEIVAGCRVTELVKQDFKPVTRGRGTYYPVIYINPVSAKYSAVAKYIGYDIGSSTSLIQQLLQRSSPDSVQLTRKVILASPFSNPYSYGVLMNYPVQSNPDNAATSQVLGYHTLVIRVGAVMSKVIQDVGLQSVDLRVVVFDITKDGFVNVPANNASLLYREDVPQFKDIEQPSDVRGYDVVVEATTRGRTYSIYYFFQDHYNKKHRDYKVTLIPVILAGLLILLDAVLLAVVFLRKATAREKFVIQDNKRSMQMLCMVNHEARNPLNVILHLALYTQEELQALVPEAPPSAACILNTAINDMGVVIDSCAFLEHVVSDILVLQRLEANMLVLENTPCVVGTIFADVERAVQHQLNDSRVQLTFTCDAEATLVVDGFRLTQVIVNMVTNSIKYTTQGVINVDCVQDVESGITTFSVEDSGRGIKTKDKPKIFTPFSELQHSDVLSVQGSNGLGLYLCKLLVERMGGKIGFESVEGKGTVFWVQLT